MRKKFILALTILLTAALPALAQTFGAARANFGGASSLSPEELLKVSGGLLIDFKNNKFQSVNPTTLALTEYAVFYDPANPTSPTSMWGALNGRATSSPRYMHDKTGKLVLVPANTPSTPCYSFKGELQGICWENTMTNWLLRSNEFTISPWTSTGLAAITVNNRVAPTGDTEASTIREDTSNGEHAIKQTLTKPAVAQTWTAGCYFAAGSGGRAPWVRVTDSTGNGAEATFTTDFSVTTDPTPKGISPSPPTPSTFTKLRAWLDIAGIDTTVVPEEGEEGGVEPPQSPYGFVRASLTFTTTADTQLNFTFGLANNEGGLQEPSTSYQGNGQSSLAVFGCEAKQRAIGATEISTMPTSYIKTTGNTHALRGIDLFYLDIPASLQTRQGYSFFTNWWLGRATNNVANSVWAMENAINSQRMALTQGGASGGYVMTFQITAPTNANVTMAGPAEAFDQEFAVISAARNKDSTEPFNAIAQWAINVAQSSRETAADSYPTDPLTTLQFGSISTGATFTGNLGLTTLAIYANYHTTALMRKLLFNVTPFNPDINLPPSFFTQAMISELPTGWDFFRLVRWPFIGEENYNTYMATKIYAFGSDVSPPTNPLMPGATNGWGYWGMRCDTCQWGYPYNTTGPKANATSGPAFSTADGAQSRASYTTYAKANAVSLSSVLFATNYPASAEPGSCGFGQEASKFKGTGSAIKGSSTSWADGKATYTFETNTFVNNGDSVTLSGFEPAEYNGTFSAQKGSFGNDVTMSNVALTPSLISFTTSVPTGAVVGNAVRASGFVPASYNGTFSAQKGTGGNTITVLKQGPLDPVQTPGTIGLIGTPVDATATWTPGKAIYTTSVPHGYLVNDQVPLSGGGPSMFNGTFTAQAGTTGSTLVVNVDTVSRLFLPPRIGGNVLVRDLAINPGPVTVQGTISASHMPITGTSWQGRVTHAANPVSGVGSPLGFREGSLLNLFASGASAPYGGTRTVQPGTGGHKVVVDQLTDPAVSSSGVVLKSLQTTGTSTWTEAKVLHITSTPHGITPGTSVTVAGFFPAEYNGTSIAQPGTQGRYIYLDLPVEPVVPADKAIIPGTANGFAVTAVRWTGPKAIHRFPADTGVRAGNPVVLTGFLPVGYNGNFIATAIGPGADGTEIQVNLPVNPGTAATTQGVLHLGHPTISTQTIGATIRHSVHGLTSINTGDEVYLNGFEPAGYSVAATAMAGSNGNGLKIVGATYDKVADTLTLALDPAGPSSTYVAGDKLVLDRFSPISYNGVYTIAAASDFSLTLTVPTDLTVLQIVGVINSSLLIVGPSGVGPVTIQGTVARFVQDGSTWAGRTTHVTLHKHNIKVGDSVALIGFTPPEYNGSNFIARPGTEGNKLVIDMVAASAPDPVTTTGLIATTKAQLVATAADGILNANYRITGPGVPVGARIVAQSASNTIRSIDGTYTINKPITSNDANLIATSSVDYCGYTDPLRDAGVTFGPNYTLARALPEVHLPERVVLGGLNYASMTNHYYLPAAHLLPGSWGVACDCEQADWDSASNKAAVFMQVSNVVRAKGMKTAMANNSPVGAGVAGGMACAKNAPVANQLANCDMGPEGSMWFHGRTQDYYFLPAFAPQPRGYTFRTMMQALWDFMSPGRFPAKNVLFNMGLGLWPGGPTVGDAMFLHQFSLDKGLGGASIVPLFASIGGSATRCTNQKIQALAWGKTTPPLYPECKP